MLANTQRVLRKLGVDFLHFTPSWKVVQKLMLQAFLEKGDRLAYAQAIEKLAGEFPRGWTKRGAALLLARRAREQKVEGLAADPAAVKAAAILLGLKRAQLEALSINGNWLLPAPKEESTDEEGTPGAAPKNPAAVAFFADRPRLFRDRSRFHRAGYDSSPQRNVAWTTMTTNNP